MKWIQASFIHQAWFVKPSPPLPPPFPRLHTTDKPDRSQKDKYILSLDLVFIKT